MSRREEMRRKVRGKEEGRKDEGHREIVKTVLRYLCFR